MISSDFHSVAIPEPTTILGVRLRPLSLGHVIILGRVRSSFITPDEPTTLHDIALSVLVCSLTFEEGLTLFNRTDLDKVFARWHRKLTKPWPWSKRVEIDYEQKARDFAEYIRRGSQIPNYSFNPQDFRDMNCPQVQLVKVAMMRDLGISEAELMDRPWAMCLWDYVTLKAAAGHVEMVDSNAIKDAQDVAAKIAESIAARKGGASCQ